MKESYYASMDTKSESANPLEDPLPNPEPASPSLPEPDTGVYHHEIAPTDPAQPATDPKTS